MNIPIVISPPAVEPVTVAEQKAHSRIDYDVEDSLIAAWIIAARQRAEGILARKLITQTVRWLPRNLPAVVKLPYPNVRSVTVQYYDSAETLQTVSASTVYRVLNANDPANDCILELLNGQTWPTTDTRAQPWLIEFVCGYGDTADSIPAEITQGIKMIVAELNERREMTISGTIIAEVPFSVAALWACHKWRPVT